MKCPSCGKDNDRRKLRCTVCGAFLSAEEPADRAEAQRPIPMPPPQPDIQTRRQEVAVQAKQRRRRKLRGYAVTGALTFFLISTVWGCPRSLQASNLLISFVMSCLFGCPMGYVIGVRGGGLIQGGLISSGAFALLNLILTHPLIPVFGVVPWLIQAGLFGLIVGLIPGGIIGLHVQLSKS